MQDLEALLRDVLERNDRNAGLVLELALAADRELAERVVVHLDHGLLRELLAEEPGIVRQLLEPEQLLPLLGITADADADDLASGIRELMQATSGNYRTDRPYLSTVYELVAERGRSRPDEALDVMIESGLFMEVMLRERPARDDRHPGLRPAEGGGAHCRYDGPRPDAAGHDTRRHIRGACCWRPGWSTSWNRWTRRRRVRRWCSSPTTRIGRRRCRRYSVSPQNDGAFILALADLQGDGRVSESMAEAIAVYRVLAADGTAPPDFLEAYAVHAGGGRGRSGRRGGRRAAAWHCAGGVRAGG